MRGEDMEICPRCRRFVKSPHIEFGRSCECAAPRARTIYIIGDSLAVRWAIFVLRCVDFGESLFRSLREYVRSDVEIPTPEHPRGFDP